MALEGTRVADFCDAVLASVGPRMSDLSNSEFTLQRPLVNISLRLQRRSGDCRRRGLDLFEKLLRLEAYEARETMKENDQRISPDRLTYPTARRVRRKRDRQ